MIVYVDNEFKCHTANDGTMTAVDTEFFNGKCSAFIEGYRFVPEGMNWTRSDGKVFKGEMITPWKPYSILLAYQTQYESDLNEMEDMQNALAELEVTVDG